MTDLDDNAVRTFEEECFLFFPSLFTADEVAVLRAAVTQVTTRTGPEVVHEPDAKAVRLMGDGVYIHQSRLNPKAAFVGESWAGTKTSPPGTTATAWPSRAR